MFEISPTTCLSYLDSGRFAAIPCFTTRKPFGVLVEGRFLNTSGEGGIRTRGRV